MFGFVGISIIVIYPTSRCMGNMIPPVVLSRANLSAFNERMITITPYGIRIQIKDCSLLEVLQHIDHMSGIRFSLSGAIKEDSIMATIDAPDWPAAVQSLLSSFNTVEVWDKTGSRLLKVYILGRNEQQNAAAGPADSSIGGNNQETDEMHFSDIPPLSSLPPPPAPPPVPFP